MTENWASEAIHFCVAALTCPTAREKLAKAARHAEFWLTHIAARTLHGVQVYRNGRFCSVCHSLYVGVSALSVKAQDAAVELCSYWR